MFSLTLEHWRRIGLSFVIRYETIFAFRSSISVPPTLIVIESPWLFSSTYDSTWSVPSMNATCFPHPIWPLQCCHSLKWLFYLSPCELLKTCLLCRSRIPYEKQGHDDPRAGGWGESAKNLWPISQNWFHFNLHTLDDGHLVFQTSLQFLGIKLPRWNIADLTFAPSLRMYLLRRQTNV
jgi:hypothetical protein